MSVSAKLVKHHVLLHLLDHIKSCLPRYQFAYKPFLSTVLCLINDLSFSLNYVFIKTLDFTRFPFGFIYSILFFTDRQQRVKIGNAFSPTLPVKSGTLQ